MTGIAESNRLKSQLLQAIAQLAAVSFKEFVSKAIHEASSQLYKQLESAEDWLRPDFSLTINLLESNREWFAAQVANDAISALKEVQQTLITSNAEVQAAQSVDQEERSSDSLSLDSLSLVSKDDFEDWLTANGAIKFLEAELAYELHEVLLVYSYLKGVEVDSEDCAISPHAIFSTLKRAIDQLEIPATPQAVVYKALSRSILEDLKTFYVGVITATKKSQIVYKPKQVSTQNSAPTRPKYVETETNTSGETDINDSGSQLNQSESLGFASPQQQTGPVSSQTGGTSQGGASPFNTLNTLSRLHATSSGGGKLGSNDSSGAFEGDQPIPVGQYAPAQLVGAISQLQQVRADSDLIERKKLKSWIQNGLQEIPGDALNIGQQESELIDVTDRFFEVIIEKIGVSGLLERWLEKLKLTILKVVLRDKSFFSNASHPARQLLNKLAKLSASEKSDKKRLEKVLDRYIDKVVADFDSDENAIETVVKELDDLLERQAIAQKRNSDRIARAYEGKQKVANARHKVVTDINKLFEGQSVPVVVMELLDKAGWREHLALTVVRDGAKSEAYEEALNVVDVLLSWLGEGVAETDKWALELEMELEAPTILELLTKELTIVGPVGYESVLKRLEDCLFNDVEPLLVKVNRYEWPYDKSEKEIKDLRPNEQLDPQSTHWHKKVVSMKVGDWIEVKDEQGKVRCLRLAWSGSESFRFVFVDSQGMKDEDMPLEELVELFKQNRASFVESDEVPLVDQGLHQMVQSVYEELASQSSCDVLTGLLNRQAFERGLDQSISGALSKRTKATLIYIDVDKFNLTNSTYGHHAGDALLKHVAEIIKGQGLTEAFCGRLGGNEFGVILVNCSLDTSADIARAICKDVNSQPFSWERHLIETTVSVGLAEFEAEADSYDSLMRKAIVACETAKEHGRNRVVVYEAKDKEQHKRDQMLEWVQRLDQDLDKILTLRCQEIRPITDDPKARPHYEILLGVLDNGQVLPPVMLIEAAEHFGKMAKVDRWVVQNVLRWMEENSEAVSKSKGFSINLSGNSLSDDTFLEFILGQFAASTVPPELICFEITETAAITNFADAIEFIRVLKQTGCKFSLDDFGSGLSSYAYIQKLPVDYIKIDGIFIRNIANNERDQALVKSINELAHFMGMKTVAEYVENHEILNVLRTIGVDHSQGFGIKKPSLLEELVDA